MLEVYPKRQPKTVRCPHFVPEKDMQDILAQKNTNKELYQRTGQQDITMVIKQRRWRWLGHVITKSWDSITRTALRWTPHGGRRNRGRPRETWRRTIEAEMKATGKTWKESNLRRQPRIGNIGNLWSQPYVPLRRRGLCYVTDIDIWSSGWHSIFDDHCIFMQPCFRTLSGL